MTAYEVNRSTTNTLTSTTADTITLTQLWGSVRVTNQHTSNWLYATPGGETAVAEADGTVAIPPGQSRTFKAERAEGTNTVVVGVVGNGNVYTVEGMQGTLDEALGDLTAEVDTLANATSRVAPAATFAGLGDSLTVVSGVSVTANTRVLQSLSYMSWLALGELRAELVGIAGEGGVTSTTIEASHLPTILALDPAPGYCFVLAGTNDAATSEGLAATKTALTSICSRLAAAGITPIMGTLPPRNDLGGATSARSFWLSRNQWISAHAVEQGYPLVDFASLMDAASGGWPAGYNNDNVHPNTPGAIAMADLAAAVLSDLLRPLASDLTGANTDPENLSSTTNAVLLTDTDADGVPDGWTLAGTGATSALATATGIKGNEMTLTRGSADASLALAAGFTLTAGRVIRVGFRIESVISDTTGRFRLRLHNSDFTHNLLHFQDMIGNVADGYFVATLTVPAGLSSYSFKWLIEAKTTSGTVARLAQPTVYDLTDMGVA